ncbi:MAG: riboflavin biosynthesis protein RibF [Limisphaerales bacterium]
MKLLAAPQPLGVPVALAIGVFDGVHLGHQAVLRRARELAGPHAAAVAVTFDRHPAAVLAPDHAPPLITTAGQRLRALAELGLDAALVIRFDTAFSRVPAEDFVRGLAAGFGRLCAVCVGADFVFGHRRGGDLALLQRLGAELGFTVEGLPPVLDTGEPVSSTRIRELVRAGLLAGASRMLGRPYALAGQVIRGEQLGRRLGWPTANLDVAGRLTPPPGVYAACARCHPAVGLSSPPEVPPAARSFRAALNIGHRPTVSGGATSLHAEAHLLGFDGDLYGRELELEFIARLRDERRFSSVDELKEQVARDLAAVRAMPGEA